MFFEPSQTKSEEFVYRIYLSFREQTERLSAIQWILANKISELVPEVERRRSRISSLEPCRDKDLDENEGSLFICFSKYVARISE